MIRKKQSLYTSYFIMYSVSFLVGVLALLVVAYNFYKLQLRKEATTVTNVVGAFWDWVGNTSAIWIDNPSDDFPDYLFKRDYKLSDTVTVTYYGKSSALATRELSQKLTRVSHGSTFKITSDRLMNPINKPDPFELDAINRFKQDKSLQYVEGFSNGQYRYVTPLYITKPCLVCHGNKEIVLQEVKDRYPQADAFDYKDGEVRGAISVLVPLGGYAAIVRPFGGWLFFAGMAVVAVMVTNFFWFRRNVMKPIDVLESSIGTIKEGDYRARIELPARGEFSDIADTFNTTMDKIVVLIQTDEERKRLQENITRFLNIVSSASEGDLTLRADVTPDVLGSLADAFNLMSGGLTDLIKGVKTAAEEVNRESGRILNIVTEMRSGSETQLGEVRKVTGAVSESAESARSITDKTKVAQKTSENAFEQINKGTGTVQEAIEGIQLIRVTIQAINKRMKYLSERIMEIGTISQVITEITNRTDLLAVNASIEASKAGEQGKGFVVIAEEIRGLAEKAARSTKQINEIINTIQTESGVVTKHLDEESNYVERETKMATDVGGIFKETEGLIKDMNTTILGISGAAETQRELTEKVTYSMEAVQRVSQEMLKLVQSFSDIAKILSTTSKNLVSSVTRFKLPE